MITRIRSLVSHRGSRLPSPASLPHLLLSVLVASIVWPTLATAESALTSKQVGRFLDSLPDVEALGEKYGSDTSAERERARKEARRRMPYGAPTMPSEEQFERAASPFSSNLDEMRESGGWSDMVATVEKHGFDSVEEWASVGDRAMRAYASTQMAQEMPKLDAEMEKMKKSLAESGMSKQQQEAMMKMMDSSKTTMRAFQDVSEADKQAVAPHIERFESIGRDNMRRQRNR